MKKDVLKKIGVVCGVLFVVEVVSTVILNFDEIKKGVSNLVERVDWDINDWP